MGEKITDADIDWLENQIKVQINEGGHKLAEMDLKIAKAVKELQESI